MTTDGYVYTNLDKKENAYDAVQIIIDAYNVTIDYIMALRYFFLVAVIIFVKCLLDSYENQVNSKKS